MGNCFNTLVKKEIISEKSLTALNNVIQYLKEDVIQRDVFRAARHDGVCQQIARELSKGGVGIFRLLEESSVREIAGGLMFFLMYLKKPLIPAHIQAIVLDSDNKTVCPEVVAMDVLGLVKQEIEGRHLRLLQTVFDLLHHVLKYTPTDELAGCNVPISMMPIFFNLQAAHVLQWRRIATIFVELIRMAPQQLNIPDIRREHQNGDNIIVQNLFLDDQISRANQFLVQRLDQMNLVLRRYLTRTGNRGDSTCFEIYESRQRTNTQRHRS